MDIITVTLNPAIDQFVTVANFQANKVNRGQSIRLNPGGKGVNVASYLADSGLKVTVTGFLGHNNAEIFEKMFSRKKITDCFIRIPGQTRIGVKIIDPLEQVTTDINLPGLIPKPEELDKLLGMINHLADQNNNRGFVLSGNLPPGVPTDIYHSIT